MRKDHDKFIFDFSSRSSGILLHLTSLSGKFGSGDLGPEAHKFCEVMEKAGQSWWQMLPVGPPGEAPSFSPYDSCSGFAGNPYFISLTFLEQEGLLRSDEVKHQEEDSGSRVNFGEVHSYRDKRLRLAFDSFRRMEGTKGEDFKLFCTRNAFWLDDFSLYMSLKNESRGKSWTKWPDDLRLRRPDALDAARRRLPDEIYYHKFLQFKFETQWSQLSEKSHQTGVGLIGDLPIFVGHESADVWSHQELFQLDANGQSLRVSGYPPDRFNSKGQYWGHPQYQWTAHQLSDFEWWILRFRRLYSLFDAIRIDHFLGFSRTWSIPANAKVGAKARWVKSPGQELFSALIGRIGTHPMIAEDLGSVTPADIALRDAFGMLPMRIFQFGFGPEKDSADHLPHNYGSKTAAYTGNHDTDTIKGWFMNLSSSQKRIVIDYTGGQKSTLNWNCIRVLQCSPANLAIFPIQDLMGLDTRSRMNIPGTIAGNWNWRLDSPIPISLIKKLRRNTELFDRIKSHQL